MSTQIPSDDELRQRIRDQYESRMGSEQARDVDPERHNGHQRHHDGANMRRFFDMPPLYQFLRHGTRHENSFGDFPQALPRMVAQLEKHELEAINRDLIHPGEGPEWYQELPTERRRLLQWFAGYDGHNPPRRCEDPAKRMQLVTNGGFDVVIHGEQGTGKTSFLNWLSAVLLQTRPRMDVHWMASLDDTGWTLLAPWATICLPDGVDVEITGTSTLDPNPTPVDLDPTDVCRDVVRYSTPDDLIQTCNERTPGQFYVVYPDPRFRRCQAITGWRYDSVWDVETVRDATDIQHYWFAFHDRAVHADYYTRWKALLCDEAHKYVPERASSDDHDLDKKIQDVQADLGDGRKHRASFIFATQQWNMVHWMIKDMCRWGVTMAGEDFPDDSPLDASNFRGYFAGSKVDTGDVCVWDKGQWNDFGFPDVTAPYTLSADIAVKYPGWEAAKNE